MIDPDHPDKEFSPEAALSANSDQATLFLSKPTTDAQKNKPYVEYLKDFADRYMEMHGALNGNGTNEDRMRDTFYQ